MLIPNITTEFKDSNGTLRVVWDLITGVRDKDKSLRHVSYIHPVQFRLLDVDKVIVFCIKDEHVVALCAKLLVWAAPQTIEQLKAKLAF